MAGCATFRGDIWWITAFSLFAAVRVLVLSAAFPFFNNVDERRHVDLVIKYADGHMPRSAAWAHAAQRGNDLAGNASLPLALRITRISIGARRLRGRLLRTDVEASC